MEFESELELRQKLLQFIKNDWSLEQFEDWFVPHSWNFEENASPALKSLVGDIELALAEYSNGHWTKDELRRKLALLASTYRARYVFDSFQDPDSVVAIFSGSAYPHFGSLQLFDIKPVVEFELPTHP
jgi:hypothetical protein